MPDPRTSLLAGRSSEPLTERQILAVGSTFTGLDRNVPYRYEPDGPTVFKVEQDETGQDYGIVCFGPDIYPGGGLIDPNSALSMRAAVAHEICHFYRWQALSALNAPEDEFLDEALTSLEAVLRFPRELSDHEMQQLTRDAVLRIQMHHNAPGNTA